MIMVRGCLYCQYWYNPFQYRVENFFDDTTYSGVWTVPKQSTSLTSENAADLEIYLTRKTLNWDESLVTVTDRTPNLHVRKLIFYG